MADGTLKVGTIVTSSGSGTITLGQSGEKITSGSSVTNNFQNGTDGTWTSTVTYSTTLTNTSGGDATLTVTGNYHKVGKVYYWNLPQLTRDSVFSGNDVIINKFTLPATANSNSVNSRGIVGGYKLQGRYNTNDLTGDGQVYWAISAGNDYATLTYLQLNSSGTGFARLNGSGARADCSGYFIGA